MAKYKDLVGTGVVNFAGDNPGAARGQLWYDSTNEDFKYLYPNVTSAGSWRTSVDLNAVKMYVAGAGTASNAVVFGGSPSAPAAHK